MADEPVPGQVWRRKSDRLLFVVLEVDPTWLSGRRLTIKGVRRSTILLMTFRRQYELVAELDGSEGPAVDDLDLPAPDACARCRKERAAHLVGWAEGGPRHAFVEHKPRPRPEHCVPAHIQTEWVCSHCGAECDVWGAAEAWMECAECGKQSYLVPFMNAPEPDDAEREEANRG